MTIISILLTLLSNAVSAPLLFSRESIRDISVIFNRIAIITLIYSVLQEIVGLFIKNDDIGLFGGLLYTTNITQTFHMFILIISILILQLTSFSSQSSHIHINLNPLLYIKEYPVIILFIITGGIFLISANDFVSIYLSIELQSYGLYLLSTINKNSE
jgi:NADH-ubiquinone oxidoreductase chain 2